LYTTFIIISSNNTGKATGDVTGNATGNITGDVIAISGHRKIDGISLSSVFCILLLSHQIKLKDPPLMQTGKR